MVGVLVCAKGGVHHWKCGRQALWFDLGMAFVDKWVVGKEEVCYWLSNDIVGLVGNLGVIIQVMIGICVVNLVTTCRAYLITTQIGCKACVDTNYERIRVLT